MRVFLVEDNPADVWLIEECLRRRSIESAVEQHSTAEAAARALALFGDAAAVPDLMLIDFNLPCGHGIGVLEAAAQNPALEMVPKAILTSFMTPEESARAGALGVRVVVHKPSDLEGFMQVVGGAIQNLLWTAQGDFEKPEERSLTGLGKEWHGPFPHEPV
jgi:CheY-like chemotaxis protein